MNILKRIAIWRLNREVRKTLNFEDQKKKLIQPISRAFKVFKTPDFHVFFRDFDPEFDGEQEYVTLFGLKLFKKPDFLVKKKWVYTELSYTYRFGEFHINKLPTAKCIMFGYVVDISSNIPITETTNPENYWTSILEYLYGNGSQRGSLKHTILRLGKESRGVYDDDDVDSPNHESSMYFIVDKSYIKPEYYDEYDIATKFYNENESPLMI